MKFRKSFASLVCFAVFGLMMPSSADTSMHSCRFQRSRSFGSGLEVMFPLALAAVMALVMSEAWRWRSAHRSRASAAEPARTVAAFHSPCARALLIAPMSFLRFVRRRGSVLQLRLDVLGEGHSTGHF